VVIWWEPAVRPLLTAVQPKVIVEIGARYGTTTAKLVEFASETGAVVHSIDPFPSESFDTVALMERSGGRFVFHGKKSLEALPGIASIDAVLVDGDHNWYTVFTNSG
jgi:predicted O-methyltransferase YrrM